MFLKRLIIQNKSGIIREILFHKGVNFIVDETPTVSNHQITGNNVGKTTVLRLVDFCFGGDGENIYKDTEFKTQPNTNIEDFLKKTDVVITVELVDNIDDESSRKVVVKRNFLSRDKKIQEINGQSVTGKEDFDKKLKEEILSIQADKPTFRQIISKNIRDEKNKMSHIVKVLNSYTKKEEYEALYLFWLGISTDGLEEKQRLFAEKAKEEQFQKRLKKEEGELSLIEQQLSFFNGKIDEFNAQKNTLSINENYGDDIEKLNQVRQNFNRISSNLSVLEIRKDLINESKKSLETEYSNIDVLQIKSLYEKAKILVPTVQVSFEETIKFHNDLILEKIKYITKELPDLQKEIVELKSQLSRLNSLENELANKLKKSGFTEDLETIFLESSQLFEKKGNLEELKKIWEKSNEKLEVIITGLNAINDSISSKDEIIQSRITEFNKFFSEISNKLYGEYYILSSSVTDKGYELIVTNMEGNPSTGKKKGQIAAFDFAYIQFADHLDINCLHFVMHDQLESVHDNQLNTLVEVASLINGQYIVPILKDKIPPNVDVSLHETLSLSQEDKLFKI
ncbi:MAG: DUF2326 domain-containing protein [Bacteroidales bacterium]|jgi:uncharacterized protein YydD (DUF2326 family)|nr:DUF2326 domain-containing protein [Bacteroidales bacterium]